MVFPILAWGALVSACVIFALIYSTNWWKRISQRPSLFFISACLVFAAIATAMLLEMRAHHSDAPNEAVTYWIHMLPLVAALLASIAAFSLGIARTSRHGTNPSNAEANRHREELARLSRLAVLGELSGSMAHELKQPLTSILSNAQAAQQFLQGDHADLQEVKEILHDIIEADLRANETIQHLRQLFKNGETQKQPIDLNELVGNVLKILHSDLIGHRITVRTDLADKLPLVQVDPIQLHQVLVNLILNAADAMSTTDPAHRLLSIHSHLQGRGHIELAVSDHGCGIAPDSLEKIFEPFMTTKNQGMGLGLAVCNNIIAAHRGELWATNNRNGGATFHVTLLASKVNRQPRFRSISLVQLQQSA